MVVIEAAIEAHGGEENFAKTSIGRLKYETDGEWIPGYSGKMELVDVFDFTRRQHRRVVQGEVLADGERRAIHMVFFVDNDQSWAQFDHGEPIRLPNPNTTYESVLGANLNALLALKAGGIVKVLTENEIRGRTVIGLHSTLNGEWYGNMYFDPDTGYAVAARKAMPTDLNGSVSTIETYYSDFREVSGLTVPTTIETVIDNKTKATVTFKEVLFTDAIDRSEFEIPVAGE
jgi:hypothetical protein